MKKIIVILLCIYLSPVHALEYSKYTPFGDYTEEEIQADDLTDVKIERRYKFYRNSKILGPYEDKEIINEEFNQIDNDDFIYTEESKLSTIRAKDKEGRKINEYQGIYYQKANDVNSIKIINNTNNIINIEDIVLKYQDKDIAYDLNYENASNNQIENNGYIELKFSNPLILSFLTLSFKTSKEATFTLETNSLEKNQIVSRDIFTTKDTNEWKGISSNVIGDYEPYLVKIEDRIPDGRAMIYAGIRTLYTYQDIIYRKYKIEKEYYPDYLTEPYEDYIYKEENDFKDFYAKRTRYIIDKTNDLVVQDNIVIEPKEKNENQNIEKTSEIKKTITLKQIPSQNISNDIALLDEPIIESFQDYGYVPVQNINNNPIITNNKIPLWYIIGPIIILLCIIILLLSKLYKTKEKYDRV